MKHLLWILGILMITSYVSATQPSTPNISSFTTTNDTIACIVPSTGPAGSPVVTPQWLDKIIITSGSANGTIGLYNSTFTNTPVIATITLQSAATFNFQDTKVKGICYTTTNNSGGVVILYKK